ncbi:MAG: hypothetical protein AAFR17_02315, partial [Pseudomonadota bacterium]
MKADAIEIGWIGPGRDRLDPGTFGVKAARLSVAASLGLPVPPALVLAGSGLEAGLPQGLSQLESLTGAALDDPETPLLVSLRVSSSIGASATVPACLNLGLTGTVRQGLARRFSARLAADLERRMLQHWATGVLEIEGEAFEYALLDAMKAVGASSETELGAAEMSGLATACNDLIAEEGADPPPDTAQAQIAHAVRALETRWHSPRAIRRRAARGVEGPAPLAILIQQMALGLGGARSGAGIAHLRDPETGAPSLSGRFLTDAQGDEALMGLRTPILLGAEERAARGLKGAVFEETHAEAAAALRQAGQALEAAMGTAFSLDFTLDAGRLAVLELHAARLSPRAAVQLAVDLGQADAAARDRALMQIDPVQLEAHLHPMIDPKAPRDLIGRGLPASPGAASGPLVFSPERAEA